MIKRKRIITAVDVGTTKVFTAIARVSEEGIELLGSGWCASEGVRKGVIVNLSETVKCVKKSLEKAEAEAEVVVESAHVSVGGAYVRGVDVTGTTDVRGRSGEIGPDDIERAVRQAQNVQPPENSRLIHVLKQSFRVDGQEGISNPLGMSGRKLSAKVHLVLNASTVVRNIVSALNKAGVVVDAVVMQQLAAAEASAGADEKELGVIVVDIGGGTSDIVVYRQGSICHTESLPLGGSMITTDIAIGLKTSTERAEELKLRETSVLVETIGKEMIEVAEAGSGRVHLVPRELLCQIARARTDEILRSIATACDKWRTGGDLMTGVVLTGGEALLGGLLERAEQILEMPVRIGLPGNVVPFDHETAHPANCAALGLIKYAREVQDENQDASGVLFGSAPVAAGKRVKSWILERIG